MSVGMSPVLQKVEIDILGTKVDLDAFLFGERYGDYVYDDDRKITLLEFPVDATILLSVKSLPFIMATLQFTS